MCKCKREERTYESKWKKVPYCFIDDCKPSEYFLSVKKNCPWKEMKMLYGPDETALCKGAGSDSHACSHGWDNGDFSPWWCCEENCAPYHFIKPLIPRTRCL